MKSNSISSILILLLLSSCSSTNRIFINNDPYKEKTTIKLNQTMKGYSDEKRQGLRKLPDYYITFKNYYANSMDSITRILDVKMRTSVRAYEVEPTLYLSIDNIHTKLQADQNVVKMYQQGSSSSTSETSTTVTEDSDNKGEESVESTTTYTTSSSHDTYQLMQLRFNPNLELLRQISNAQKVCFRLYIDNEVIDIPMTSRNHRRFSNYMKEMEKLEFQH